MSYAEIKKAVNSDLNVPLNELINRLLSRAESPVRSVQRGVHNGSTTDINIAISSVNPAKCSVTIYPSVQGTGSGLMDSVNSAQMVTGSFPRVLGLTSTQLQLAPSTRATGGGFSSFSIAASPFSWEIVEYN